MLQWLKDGLFVATDGKTVVGYAYAMAGANRDGAGELFALYVLPGWQRHGAGWRLWQSAESHLRDEGFTGMVLWVLESTVQARGFYGQQGASAWTTRDFPGRLRHHT